MPPGNDKASLPGAGGCEGGVAQLTCHACTHWLDYSSLQA